jgi:hypothetical protein
MASAGKAVASKKALVGLGKFLASAAPAAIAAGSSIYSANRQSRAAEESARIATDAANRAAELEAESNREALEYMKSQDRLSRQDWLDREARLTPYRNIGAASAHTLGGLVRVPGSVVGRSPAGAAPAGASAGHSRGGPDPASVLGPEAKALFDAYRAEHGFDPNKFKDFVAGWAPYMKERGYGVEVIDHPERLDKVWITTPKGQRVAVDMVVGAGGSNPSAGWIPEAVEGHESPGGGRSSRANTLGQLAPARSQMRFRRDLLPSSGSRTPMITPQPVPFGRTLGSHARVM